MAYGIGCEDSVARNMDEIILEKTFGGIKGEYATLKKSKAVIVPCPYEGTVTYKKGTKNGPKAIIDASLNMELFDEELGSETFRSGIYTMPALALEELSSAKMIQTVSDTVSEIIKMDKLPVVLGGEHSVSIGAIKAAREICQSLSVLYLDAHYDLKDEYAGSKYSHACAARRVLKMCPVVEAVTRSFSKEEKDFVNTNPAGLSIFSAYDILDTPDWKEKVSDRLSDAVYVSIDLDVFDPSLVPSVGTPEPGGIGWYELLDLLKQVTREKKVIGFDVVELSPQEGVVAPDFLAAKLTYRLLGYTLSQKKVSQA